MTSDLAPVVRILAPSTLKWMGCGFLIPPYHRDRKLYVMTCAHVVVDALGIGKDEDRETAPDKAVVVQFDGSYSDPKAQCDAWVVPGKWFPPDPKVLDGQKPIYDIAVLRLDLDRLPDGVAFPRFSSDVHADNRVFPYGPQDGTALLPSSAGIWPPGKLRKAARADQIEFLVEPDVKHDRVSGGFSGGPLTMGANGGDLRHGQVRRVEAGPICLCFAALDAGRSLGAAEIRGEGQGAGSRQR